MNDKNKDLPANIDYSIWNTRTDLNIDILTEQIKQVKKGSDLHSNTDTE